MTYRLFLGSISARARLFLRKQLEPLFHVLLLAEVHNLPAMLKNEERVTVNELKAAVEAECLEKGVNSHNPLSGVALLVDWADVAETIAHHNGWICVSELAVSYNDFATRNIVLLGELSRQMDYLGVSSYELFSSAKKKQGGGGGSGSRNSNNNMNNTNSAVSKGSSSSAPRLESGTVGLVK